MAISKKSLRTASPAAKTSKTTSQKVSTIAPMPSTVKTTLKILG